MLHNDVYIYLYHSAELGIYSVFRNIYAKITIDLKQTKVW